MCAANSFLAPAGPVIRIAPACMTAWVQEGLIGRCMTATAGVGLVMNVFVRMTALHRYFIHVCRVDLKDSRLVMVDPDQDVIVLVHKPPGLPI
jgi:hypothetical protein